MTVRPDRIVEITYEYASANDLNPTVTIHNAGILIPSLRDQIERYGLHKTTLKGSTMVGDLKGGRENFVAMIHSYGFTIGAPATEAI